MKVNGSDVEWSEYDQADATFRRKELGDAAGGEQLGLASTSSRRANGPGPTTTTPPTRKPSTCSPAPGCCAEPTANTP